MRRSLVQLIEAGIANGEFRKVDPWETTKLVIAPFLLTAIWLRTFEGLDERPFDTAALIRQHVDMLLRGLAPDPAPAASGD